MLGVTTVAFFRALEVSSRLAQTSDSAQGLVVGHAIANGNVLLSGWYFPVDNFYFTDSLFYALTELIVGTQPFLLALVPALSYALFVLLALVACLGPTQRPGRNLESCAAVALLLASPIWIGAWNPMLMSDMHTATVLAAFAGLMLCAIAAGVEPHSGGVRAAAAIGFVLVAMLSVASDPFSLIFAFAPAAVILTIESARGVRSQNARFVLALLAVAVAAGLFLPWAIGRAGGFTSENDVAFGFASVSQWRTNAVAALFGTLTLLGANPLDVHGISSALIFSVRCVALAILMASAVTTLRKVSRCEDVPLFDRLLWAGTLILIAACLPSAQFAKGARLESMWHGGPPMRFLVPAVLFSAVLAARQIPQMLDCVCNPRWRVGFRNSLVIFAAFLFTSALQSVSAAGQPQWIADNAATTAAHWLKRHGLAQGAGEYWSANLVTAMSGNAVVVRSVVPKDGRLVPYVWVEDRRFYAEPPQFVIWQEPNRTGLTQALVRATYPVCSVGAVAGYRIALLKTVAPGICTDAARSSLLLRRGFGEGRSNHAHPSCGWYSASAAHKFGSASAPVRASRCSGRGESIAS